MSPDHQLSSFVSFRLYSEPKNFSSTVSFFDGRAVLLYNSNPRTTSLCSSLLPTDLQTNSKLHIHAGRGVTNLRTCCDVQRKIRTHLDLLYTKVTVSYTLCTYLQKKNDSWVGQVPLFIQSRDDFLLLEDGTFNMSPSYQ